MVILLVARRGARLPHGARDEGHRRSAAAPASARKAQRRVELTQLVAFGVADGDYALDIMRIKEIINPVPVTPMPKAPPFIEGVIELRGAILPIVDVRKRFDLSADAADARHQVPHRRRVDVGERAHDRRAGGRSRLRAAARAAGPTSGRRRG